MKTKQKIVHKDLVLIASLLDVGFHQGDVTIVVIFRQNLSNQQTNIKAHV